MKKISSLLVLSAISLSVIACGSSPTPEISHKNITVHGSTTQSSNAEFYFFNSNLDIPYLEIMDTFNTFCDQDIYSISQANDVYTVTNKKTSTTMTVNVNGTVTYADFTKFKKSSVPADGCYIDEFQNTSATKQKIAAQSTYTPSQEWSFNLSDFNFKPTLHEGKYYLPINVFHSLFNVDQCGFYYDAKGEIYLLGADDGIYSMITPKTAHSKEFYGYCFDMFALKAELQFGLKGYSRTLRYNNQKLDYMPNGVKQALAPYREDIVNSSDVLGFDNKMVAALNTVMTDGGHTTGYHHSIGADHTAELTSSEEALYLQNMSKGGQAIRESKPDTEGFKSNVFAFDTDSDGKKDIGYVTFDSFEESDDPETHAPSTFKVFNEANKLLNKNSEDYDSTTYDIKDVVIDISLNGGGDVPAEGFALSWICGGVAQETLRATNGHALSTYTYNFDVNGDSEFNNKDYLPNDVNVYILMSPVTYSAANSLAYNSYLYNRKAAQVRKVKFMGQQSGGGAASTTGVCYLPSGFTYRLANNDVSVDIDNVSVACENGVQPDTGLKISTFNDLFNRTGQGGINELVVSQRKPS